MILGLVAVIHCKALQCSDKQWEITHRWSNFCLKTMESCKKRWIKFMIGDFLTIKITEAHINIQLEVINGDLKVRDKYIPYSTTCHKSKKIQIF